MRAPVSWVAEHVDLPAGLTARELAEALVRVGLEVERVESAADAISGPIVVARVLSFSEEPQKSGKIIRWCSLDTGESDPRGIVCGAGNFAVGDLVIVALPGAVLPGPFPIAARKTYGHISDGMICSARELGLGDDHDGILILDPQTPAPQAIVPGTDGLDALHLSDAVLDIAVTPDRGYCLSIRGLAREAAAALDVTFHDIAPALPPVNGLIPVTVEDAAGCDQFAVRAVSGFDPSAPSPEFLTRRLRACGMRPVSLAVDVTNYVMLETGQPLHAFDRSKLRGGLQVRRARAGEQLLTLDHANRLLNPEDLVVADDSGPVALGGVMGGATTEISDATTEILIEAAHWDPALVSRSSRRHKLTSEASKRLERGVDPAIAAAALQRCVQLLCDHGSARPDVGYTVVGVAPSGSEITLAISHPGELAGMTIDPEQVRARLRQVGCELEGQQILTVRPPSWRPDLTDPADLIEEVIRLVGYDKVPSALPSPPPGRGLTESQRLRRTVSRAIAGAGYTEVITYPFVSPSIHDTFGLDADDDRRNALTVLNPLSEAEPELRTSLLPGLLGALSRNLGRSNRDLAIFEIGLVYRGRAATAGFQAAGVQTAGVQAAGVQTAGVQTAGVQPAELLAPGVQAAELLAPGVARRLSAPELAAAYASVPEQPRHAAVVLAGDLELPGWWGPGRGASWSDAVDAARTVARAAGVHLSLRARAHPPWHPGRCAQLLLGERVIGAAGELHPQVIKALQLPARTCAMELDLDAFDPPAPAIAPALTAFPPVLLDVALVVPHAVAAAELTEAVRLGAGELLESIRLFDVFADRTRLGDGLKSVAFALKFRAQDRTLTVDEATAARDRAIAAAADQFGAALRS